MATTIDHSRLSSNSNIDLEKEETHQIEPHHVEAINTTPTHALEKSETARSNHPLEQVVSHRTYSGWQWVLVCLSLYIVSFD
jgi:hypothetical protein